MVGQDPSRAEVRRLYQQVADRIRGLIRDGTFPVNGRLPPERDLAQRLGVSRPCLREALIALEIDGSLDIRMGSGVYVLTAGEDLAPATGPLGDSPSELMQARVVIEGALIVQACARMVPGTLKILSGAIEELRAALDEGGEPLRADRLFHETIAQQAGNAVLSRMIGSLFDERLGRLARRFSWRFEDRDTWLAALAEHEAIYAALKAADPLRAQSAMCAHLYQSAERWIAER